MYQGPPIDKEKEVEMNKQFQRVAKEQMPPRNPYQGGYNPQPTLPTGKVDP